jgi:hypothetical protein
VESRLGDGSRFTLRLPSRAAAVAPRVVSVVPSYVPDPLPERL